MTLVNDRPELKASSDASRWADIVRVPHAPFRAAVARRIFRRAAGQLPLRVVESRGDTSDNGVADGGGRQYGSGSGHGPVMHLERPDSFFNRLGSTGTIGFGEAFMASDWTTDDLAGVLSAFASNMDVLVPPTLRKLRHVVLSRMPEHHDNTVEGARQNISHHYDLSNELFKTFLDPSLTYSSALFDGDPARSNESLEEAQHRKIDRLLDAAGVHSGTRVLEIGTGWGELAIRAARRGAQVTSLTISTEQADLARERIEREGLSERATVLLQDYRDTTGTFDAVVSVEMIEAVGTPHWSTYFGTIDKVLCPGGRVGLQAILQDDSTVRETQDTYTWIRKYIFPGGQIASTPAIERTLAAGTSLRITESYNFGKHYAETLRRWRATFEAEAAAVDRLGFDETFRRMWSLYLAYSEAGFRSGYLDVAQFTMVKA
ncbi:MAG TPA: cyclopropane-fatty-acyl-phospholipid synthase family protein [Jatrophihabitans sp.]